MYIHLFLDCQIVRTERHHPMLIADSSYFIVIKAEYSHGHWLRYNTSRIFLKDTCTNQSYCQFRIVIHHTSQEADCSQLLVRVNNFIVLFICCILISPTSKVGLIKIVYGALNRSATNKNSGFHICNPCGFKLIISK